MKAVKQYERKLMKNLNCFPKTKSILIRSFRNSLEDFLVETPEPTFDAIVEAFGTPEEMAKTLMTNVSSKELANRKVLRIVKRVIAAVLVLLFLALTYHVYVQKSIPEYTKDTGNLISEVENPD